MPLKGIKVSDSVKRITFKDYLPFKYEITDADIKYPVAVFKNFCKYVNSKYKAGVWGDQFLNKGDSSIVTLVYYVPIKFTKEEIEADVKAFENQYEDLKIEIKINTPQQEFNTYTDFKKGLLNQPWNLELAKKLFRLNWHSEPNLDDPDDQEELLILFNMNQESYHEYYVVDATMFFNVPDFARNRIGEKNIDLHVYHVGDSMEPGRLEHENQAREILNNNPDAYAVIYGYGYDKKPVVYLEEPKIVKTQEEVDNYRKKLNNDYKTKKHTNGLHVTRLYVVYKEQPFGGTEMKKDADPRLGLVKELKEYGLTDEYSLDDEFLCDDDYGIYSINKKEFLDLLNEQKDSLSLSDKFSNLSTEDLEKLDKNKFLEFMRECRDDQEWDVHTWLNDINGLRECLKLYKDEKSTTNDSTQKEICDSFDKRYNK